MSRKPESQFIFSVHKHISSTQVYSMKNHNAYVGGIADVWYSGRTADLWIEYKFITSDTPRLPVVPTLSPQQFRWIKDRKKEGRNVWVIVGHKKGGVIYRDLIEIELGIPPKEFIERMLSRKALAAEIYDFCYKEPKNETT